MTETATTSTARPRPERRFAGAADPVAPAGPGRFADSAPIVLPERAKPRPRPTPTRAELEELGRRTAGVAHDFNNLLSVVMVCAGEIADAAEDRAQRERAEEIRDAARHGAELSRGLLVADRAAADIRPGAAGAADAAGAAEPVAVDEAVLASARLIERALGPGVRLDIASDGALPGIGLPASELERVLLNLAANARDAMPSGGAVAIRSGVVSIPPGDHCLGTGWHVRIAFADGGSGMGPDVAARALEPYFSTKADAGGSGLGLASAQAMIRMAGGDLRINSRPGSGTTVSIYLPALDSAGRPLALPGAAR